MGRSARSTFAAAVAALAMPVAASANGLLWIRHLSADVVQDAEPRISGDRVAWQKARNVNSEIWIWDPLDGARAITENGVADEAPDVDGDLVVWQQHDLQDFEVVQYDVVLDLGTSLSVNTGPDDVSPRISGTNVVFQRASAGVVDMVLEPEPGQITGDAGADSGHDISGANVAWIKETAGNRDVWAYFSAPDLLGSYQIDDNEDEYSPSISGERVIFVRGEGTTAEIWRYDPRNFPMARVTVDGFEDRNPQIDGANAVWERDSDGDFDLYHWIDGGGLPVAITDNAVDDHSVQIDGEDLVWVSEEASGPEIWACFSCFSGGTPQRVSHYFTEADRNPRIDGGRIVWENCANPGLPSEECDILRAPEPGARGLGGAAVAALALLGRGRRAARPR